MPDTNLPVLASSTGVETYRASTDAAGLCREIVKATAQSIQGRQYVKVEGWQSIAVAHGCTASSLQVERVEGGFKATGQVRRMDTGAVIAEAEGFVGEDEAVWFGGETVDKWGKKKIHQKRPDFAIRAMAQTRAISRACRSAFAHVVVMIDKNLSTTPAEEMQGIYPGEGDGAAQDAPGAAPARGGNWVDEARNDGTLDETRAKGTLPGKAAPAAKLSAAEKAKDWTDRAIQTLNLGDHTLESLGTFWKENADKIEWLEAKATEQHERFIIAWDNANDAAKARVAA